jgi:hypothetical protein
MTNRQYRQYEMLVRVRDFGKLYQDRFPEGGTGRTAFAAVGAVVAEVEAFVREQQTGSRRGRQAKLQARKALKARLVTIARSARVVAKTTLDFDARFPLPARKSDVAVLQSGQLFLKEAAAVKEAFVRCGLPDTFIDDLQQAVTAFEEAVAGTHDGRTRGKVSSLGIRSALASGMSAVDSLDVLVANVLGGDLTTMETWKHKRRVDVAVRTSIATPTAHVPQPQPANPVVPTTVNGTDAASRPTASVDDPLQKVA